MLVFNRGIYVCVVDLVAFAMSLFCEGSGDLHCVFKLSKRKKRN